MKTFQIKTFGCSMNIADSERVCFYLENLGLKETEKDPDILIFNTCKIKQKAEDKVFSLVHNAYKNKNIKKIILTGCMVKKTSTRNEETKKDQLLNRIKEIDAVFRIEDLYLLGEILGLKNNPKKIDYFEYPQKSKNNFQAIVPIQSGCDNFCSYCVVPYTRGREYSRLEKDIVNEVENLVLKGVKEIILVGQNVNSYGKEFVNLEKTTKFTQLLEKLVKIKNLKRIRFQTSNPHDLSDDIIDIITSEKKIMPHLHFALQSGDNEILKKMNRKYTSKNFLSKVEKIKKKRSDFCFTTDVIVGFPTENKEAFLNTIQVLKKFEPEMVFIGKYSERPQTLAQKIYTDNVSQTEKKERFHLINEFLKKLLEKKYNKLIGKTDEVLIEEKIKNNLYKGKTPHNRNCFVEAEKLSLGDIVKVKITKNNIWSLTAKKIDEK